jgi:hypothetical protein
MEPSQLSRHRTAFRFGPIAIGHIAIHFEHERRALRAEDVGRLVRSSHV